MTTITSSHTNACFQTWMMCEDLLTDLQTIKSFISKKVVNVIDECAFICLGTFNALKAGSAEVHNMAFLCVGICEECADVCEQQKSDEFQKCARTCRECADRLSKLTFFSK